MLSSEEPLVGLPLEGDVIVEGKGDSPGASLATILAAADAPEITLSLAAA